MQQNILYTAFTFWYKINWKYLFPDPSGRKRITDPFYPTRGKAGHFSDGVWIDIFGAYSFFFVLYADKHGLKCPMKALNCIQKLFKKYSGPIGSEL